MCRHKFGRSRLRSKPEFHLTYIHILRTIHQFYRRGVASGWRLCPVLQRKNICEIRTTQVRHRDVAGAVVLRVIDRNWRTAWAAETAKVNEGVVRVCLRASGTIGIGGIARVTSARCGSDGRNEQREYEGTNDRAKRKHGKEQEALQSLVT
jgi:hypothetical protein